MRALNEDVFNILASIATVALFMLFILVILKLLMDHRIRNRILDKGISGELAASILQSDPKAEKKNMIKWVFILSGSGIGLAIINYTLPLGFHSLAIMAFSMAAGFLGYAVFLHYQKKPREK